MSGRTRYALHDRADMDEWWGRVRGTASTRVGVQGGARLYVLEPVRELAPALTDPEGAPDYLELTVVAVREVATPYGGYAHINAPPVRCLMHVDELRTFAPIEATGDEGAL